MGGFNVLSLFDGISCGQIALQRAGVPVERYFASEIKKIAIETTQKHFPNTVQIGDVRNLKYENGALYREREIIYTGKFDLLIGGSPCQNLSSINMQDSRGLKGQKSRLFWEYVRLKNETNPKYFFLENVASMNKAERDKISMIMEVEPIPIDSGLVSAQMRRRLYWTNIPGITQPEDRGIMPADILEPGRTLYHTRKNGKAACLVRSYGGRNHYADKDKLCNYVLAGKHTEMRLRQDNYVTTINPLFGDIETLTITEMERLQTVPAGYCSHLTHTQAADVLGDGWTIDVIAHCFSFIPVMLNDVKLSLFT